MKFLVTGAAGLVGRQVIQDLSETGEEVYSAYHDSKPEIGIPTPMDLNCLDKIKETIEKVRPDSIIHLAALTNVYLCEKENNLEMKINAKTTKV